MSKYMAGVGVCMRCYACKFCGSFLSFLAALGQCYPIQLPVEMGMFWICATIW